MNNINYNPNQRFYDYRLNKDDINIDQTHKLYYLYVNDQQLNYFISKIDEYSKNILNDFTEQQIKNTIYKKRLDNLNAIQNGIVYKNGKDDNKIELNNYKNYYHIIFEYDANKCNEIRDFLSSKYNVKNVNLYVFDKEHLIYIFDKDSNFESKTNSPLFSNLNNRVNNYNKINLIKQKIFICDLPNIHLLSNKVWYCDYYNGIIAKKFNNIFDQNWYNRFCHNFKIFLQSQLKQTIG